MCLVRRLSRRVATIVAVLSFCFFTTASAAAKTSFYVDCEKGSDEHGEGTTFRPWASLSRARDAIRSLQPLDDDVDVLVAGDCYPTNEQGNRNFSHAVLELDPVKDSGKPGAVITYKTQDNRVRARLLGGLKIPPEAWERETGSILLVSLKDLGVGSEHFGSWGGFSSCTNMRLELFFGGQAMTLARYPNLDKDDPFDFRSWLQVNTTGNVSWFTTTSARPFRWTKEKEPQLHGYWKYDWWDQFTALLNVSSRTDGAPGAQLSVTTQDSAHNIERGAKFYAFNLRCELDSPGEYYFDSDTGVLYFWPPDDIEEKETVVSLASHVILAGTDIATARTAHARSAAILKKHLSVRQVEGSRGMRHSLKPDMFDGVMAASEERAKEMTQGSTRLSNVAFEGLGIHYSRGWGMQIIGGVDITLTDIEVTSIGESGISLDGESIIASDLHVSEIGCSGISMTGGDVHTLTPSRNVIDNASIHHFARRKRTYQPGIMFGGVGHTVQRSTIGMAPHAGILGRGNDCTFEGNLLHDLCLETSDAGAWYSGRTWTQSQGTAVVGNTFINVRNRGLVVLGWAVVSAVYLDDQVSGIAVVNNTIVHCQRGVLVGGGRDITLGFNVFSQVDTAISIDTRGEQHVVKGHCDLDQMATLVSPLRAVNFQAPPYASRYPRISTYLYRSSCSPADLIVIGNSLCIHNTTSRLSGSRASRHLSTPPRAHPAVVETPPSVLKNPLNSFVNNTVSYCFPTTPQLARRSFGRAQLARPASQADPAHARVVYISLSEALDKEEVLA
eukprot:440780-Rhodomonas_salina.2